MQLVQRIFLIITLSFIFQQTIFSQKIEIACKADFILEFNNNRLSENSIDHYLLSFLETEIIRDKKKMLTRFDNYLPIKISNAHLKKIIDKIEIGKDWGICVPKNIELVTEQNSSEYFKKEILFLSHPICLNDNYYLIMSSKAVGYYDMEVTEIHLIKKENASSWKIIKSLQTSFS